MDQWQKMYTDVSLENTANNFFVNQRNFINGSCSLSGRC